jgi:hypothetical protein
MFQHTAWLLLIIHTSTLPTLSIIWQTTGPFSIVTYSGVLFTMELYCTPKSQHTTVKHSQQLFEHTYTSDLHGLGTLTPIEFFRALMMETACTSKTSVDNYFTWQYIPEDKSELHTRRRENLKSHMTIMFMPWIHLPGTFTLPDIMLSALTQGCASIPLLKIVCIVKWGAHLQKVLVRPCGNYSKLIIDSHLC